MIYQLYFVIEQNLRSAREITLLLDNHCIKGIKRVTEWKYQLN
jgi:hypothetical protein